MNFRTGYSLAEVLATTCLVAGLSAAAVPPLTRHLDTAKDTIHAYNVRALQQTIEIFAVQEGSYPACLTELVEAGYLYSLPVNPWTGQADYRYDPESGKIGLIYLRPAPALYQGNPGPGAPNRQPFR